MKKNRTYKWLILFMIATMEMSACEKNNEGKREENKIQENIIVNGTVDEVENFHNLMAEDKSGDKKSVYWDGSKATFEEDVYDDPNINDGRAVIEGTQSIKIPLVFELVYTNYLKDVVVENDNEENYHIEAKNYDIRVELIDYKEEKEKMASDSNFAQIIEPVLADYQTESFKEYELYSGIVTTSRGDYAGYSLIFDSALDNRAYRVTCSGIGCMNDIRQEAFYIMDHFDVLFF